MTRNESWHFDANFIFKERNGAKVDELLNCARHIMYNIIVVYKAPMQSALCRVFPLRNVHAIKMSPEWVKIFLILYFNDPRVPWRHALIQFLMQIARNRPANNSYGIKPFHCCPCPLFPLFLYLKSLIFQMKCFMPQSTSLEFNFVDFRNLCGNKIETAQDIKFYKKKCQRLDRIKD